MSPIPYSFLVIMEQNPFIFLLFYHGFSVSNFLRPKCWHLLLNETAKLYVKVAYIQEHSMLLPESVQSTFAGFSMILIFGGPECYSVRKRGVADLFD